MRNQDIRFSRENVTVQHHSSRGKVVRNAGNFTRGSQLISHDFLMTYAGIKVPILAWAIVFLIAFNVTAWIRLGDHEVQMILQRILAWFWLTVDLDPHKLVNVTLRDGRVFQMPMALVPYHPQVALACEKAWRCFVGSALMSVFIAAPITLWFIDLSRRKGREVLEERHERGAMLVERDVLIAEIQQHNARQMTSELRALPTPLSLSDYARLAPKQRRALDLPSPYRIAGVPYPWRLEQSHTMLIGTTGAGKTTQLRSLVRQMRERGHRAVIFDLTGAFVEAFYTPATDTILNPMDERCPSWTIFNDCDNYADFVAAAAALIPSDGNSAEPFWAMAARTLFVEMCMKLKARGETSNAAIAHNLMTADLKRVHALLQNTIADPLTATQAARMAESIRAVFNTNAQVLRFLPDQGEPFSIVKWMTGAFEPGGILFITSNHTDLTLNRALLTLWMDMAVNALMRLPRTRDLRTWFLFDEVHALHRLPAIEHGLQTARGFGGAFVLGMHSFDKLAETYGEQGAVNLASLARTKLILATADIETARRCADFIGNREVRQMDEAYSYGYNNTRDASTLTPRKVVEPLVIPDDITNLPSMHGFVKFPDGFPAARIVLRWQDDPQVAPGFVRKAQLTPAAYTAMVEDDAEGEDGGEGVRAAPTAPGEHGEQESVAPLSEAEIAAQALEIEDKDRTIAHAEREADTRAKGSNDDDEQKTDAPRMGRYVATSSALTGEPALGSQGSPGAGGSRAHTIAGRTAAQLGIQSRHEHQITREDREGVGTDIEAERDEARDDDGLGI